eukprot:TRINITY_DN14899_c0_g1_i1.p1 TRINITY_DN14899_c0_g1~~TRINITY_DN14899_c0_g1_i1.p1  ORF type:complete len:238 (-),score=56.84 TRINITY_DN14899_c0_g1_i1:33-746(-)
MAGRDGFGSKPGSGGVPTNDYVDRRERLRQIALQTIDLAKDPYFMKNHLGSYECKLCLTLHNNEGSYLAHTQGKRHQTNLKRRAAKDAIEKGETTLQQLQAQAKPKVPPKRLIKIGRPGYKVIKQHDPETGSRSLQFEIEYPEISEGIQPRHRFMSSFEQRIEPADKRYMYLLFAADPYETIAFKIPNWEIERDVGKVYANWDREKLTFTLHLQFKPPTSGSVLNNAAAANAATEGL